MKRKRPLSNDERRLWDAVTGDVRRLANQPKAAPKPGPRRDPVEQTAPKRTTPPRPPSPTPPMPHRAAPTPPAAGRGAVPGLDRRTSERLRKGQQPIEARLDLHGMKQTEAHAALHAFVTREARSGARCLLVITGKGSRDRAPDSVMPERSGVLRTLVPRWLHDPSLKGLVLAVQPSLPRHGGGGALYVLLRRQRGVKK
jgi:DNA-nicking Smr family endonuclease